MANELFSPIVAPGLNISNYGEAIDSQFKNIDLNFEKIAKTDFLKGNAGDSVQIVEYEFKKDGKSSIDGDFYLNDECISPSIIYTLLRDAIKANFSKNELLSIPDEKGENILWDKYLDEYNKITFIYRNNEELNRRVIVSSLYYIFKDLRFNKIDYDNEELYINSSDTSCVVSLQPNSDGLLEFVRINAFPTIYYNTEIKNHNGDFGSFCWVINGNKTEISAEGPRGETGKFASVQMVKVKTTDPDSNVCDISEVLYIDKDKRNTWIDIKSFIDLINNPDSDYKDVYFGEGSTVLAIKEEDLTDYIYSQENPSIDKVNRLFVSYVYTKSVRQNGIYVQTYCVNCDDNNSIISTFNTSQLKQSMSDIYGSDNLGGLFVPITSRNNILGKPTSQAGHMIYALPYLENSKNHHLYIGPMDDVYSKPNAVTWDDGGDTINGDPKIYEPRNCKLTFLYNTTRADNDLEIGGDISLEGDIIDMNNLNMRGDITGVNKLSTYSLKVGGKLDDDETHLYNFNNYVHGNLIITDSEKRNTKFSSLVDSSFGNETKQVNTNIFGKLNSLGVLKVLNNSIEDEKEQILFEVNPDGITYTKTEQNPTGSDENKNIYNVYVKDNAFFASDVKMSNLNVNALTSDSLETTDVECDEISVNIIDTDKLVSKSSTITELETSGHTSLGNNAVDVNVKEKLVEVNNLLKVNKDLQIGDSVFIHHDQSFNDIDFVKTIIDEQTPKFQLINGTSSYIHNDLDKGSLSSSLFGLWEKPIYTYSSTNWSNADIWHEPNINLSTSFDIPVWERKVENGSFEVPNTFQLSFTSNMSIPFTVSGRNLYAKSIWGNKWSCPKLTGTAVTVTVYKIFKSNNTDSTITSIAKSITINGKDVVENGVIFNKENNLDKKLFDNGSKSRYNYAKSNADSPGDTAVCMLTTSLPASIEFPAAMSDEDGSTLQKVILRVDVNINTYRTRTNNEDGNTFRTYRGLKVLGIIPSSKTSDLNLNTQILARIKDFFKEDGSDQYEMPLEGYEFVGETNAWAKNKAKYYFDKMILPKSYSSKMLNVSSILSNTYVKYEDKTGPIEAHICKDGIGFGNRSLEHVFITTDPIHKKVSLRVFHKDSEDAKLKYVDCNLFDLLLKNKYSEKDYEKDFSKEFE